MADSAAMYSGRRKGMEDITESLAVHSRLRYLEVQVLNLSELLLPCY